jgi:ATP-dependent DNA helicase DinG
MTATPKLEDVLSVGGVLTRRLSDFRVREQQIRMARAVSDAIASGNHLVVEAPTGTGKSLAYLVPAILDWVAKGARVVVSTYTIALQEQLFSKDLPQLAASLPIEFMTEKALGRGNYLGIRRMEQALTRSNTLLPGDSEAIALREILEWSRETGTGLRQDLVTNPSHGTWDLVRSETDNCMGRRCHQFEACFFQSARRRWQRADVLVTNHALLLTDLRLRQVDMGFLPEYDVLIIDESHRFESVAVENFGLEVSRRAINTMLRRIVGSSRFPGILRKEGSVVHEAIGEQVRRIAAVSSQFFDGVDQFMMGGNNSTQRLRSSGLFEDPLGGPLLQLSTQLASLADATTDPSVAADFTAYANRSRDSASTLRQILDQSAPEMVYFAERNERRRETQLIARPLNVSELLRTHLFDKKRCVVMTSATLSTDGTAMGLGHFRERMGCQTGESLVLSSPFQLAKQVTVEIASDLPEPDHADFIDLAARRAGDAILTCGGGAFFCSRASKCSTRSIKGSRQS